MYVHRTFCSWTTKGGEYVWQVARGLDLRGESFGYGSDGLRRTINAVRSLPSPPIRMLRENPAVMSYGMTCQ